MGQFPRLTLVLTHKQTPEQNDDEAWSRAFLWLALWFLLPWLMPEFLPDLFRLNRWFLEAFLRWIDIVVSFVKLLYG